MGFQSLRNIGLLSFPEIYWFKWTKKLPDNYEKSRSWVDPGWLMELEIRANYWNLNDAKGVYDNLLYGAKIECTGRG